VLMRGLFPLLVLAVSLAACGGTAETSPSQALVVQRLLNLGNGPRTECTMTATGGVEWSTGSSIVTVYAEEAQPGAATLETERSLDLTGYQLTTLSLNRALGNANRAITGEAMLMVVAYPDTGTVTGKLMYYADVDDDNLPEVTPSKVVTGLVEEDEAVVFAAGAGDHLYLYCRTETDERIVLLEDTDADDYPDERVGTFADLTDLASTLPDGMPKYLLSRRVPMGLVARTGGGVELVYGGLGTGISVPHRPGSRQPLSLLFEDTDADDEADDYTALGKDYERGLSVLIKPTPTYAKVRFSAHPGRTVKVVVRPEFGPDEELAAPMEYPIGELYVDRGLNRNVVAGERVVLVEADGAEIRELEFDVPDQPIVVERLEPAAFELGDTITVTGAGFADATGAPYPIECTGTFPVGDVDPDTYTTEIDLTVTVLSPTVLEVTIPAAVADGESGRVFLEFRMESQPESAVMRSGTLLPDEG